MLVSYSKKQNKQAKLRFLPPYGEWNYFWYQALCSYHVPPPHYLFEFGQFAFQLQHVDIILFLVGQMIMSTTLNLRGFVHENRTLDSMTK